MRKILSITGGGIRGIIPCLALIKLEEDFQKLSREIFDFVAGTSTGALLAAAIAAGIPAKDILKVYTDRSKEIFTGPVPDVEMLGRGYKYLANPMETVMEETLGPAKDWTMNDSPIRLLLTAMGVQNHPWYFVQDRPKNSRVTGKLRLIDCAVASACAPTYFPPWYVSPLGGKLIGKCFDGGVGVTGNPVYQACVEAFDYDDFDPKDTRVISLGTGTSTEKPDPDGPHGILATIEWTINAVLDATENQQPEFVRRHWPGLMREFNPTFPGTIDMADTSAIPQLVKTGEEAAATIDWQSALAA